MGGTFAIIKEADAADRQLDPTFGRVPGVSAVRQLSPDDYVLWLCVLDVADGTSLRFPAQHGDEGLYVMSGELAVGDQSCVAGGAVIVESDVPASVRVHGQSRLIHVGSRQPTPAADAGELERGVHVVGPDGWFVSGRSERTVARWFADGTCPSCRIQLFDVSSDETPGRHRAHTHSADEIIYVLEGTMMLGRRSLGPGTSLCIGGDTRYAQGAGPGGCTFLNFRRETSEQQYFGPGEPEYPLPETALARGGSFVGDVVHLPGSAVNN